MSTTYQLAGHEDTVKIWVPERFYQDHTERDLPSGRVLKYGSQGALVALDREAFADLLSDAEFYAEGGVAEFGQEYLGLISSARATVKRLRKAIEDGRVREVTPVDKAFGDLAAKAWATHPNNPERERQRED